MTAFRLACIRAQSRPDLALPGLVVGAPLLSAHASLPPPFLAPSLIGQVAFNHSSSPSRQSQAPDRDERFGSSSASRPQGPNRGRQEFSGSQSKKQPKRPNSSTPPKKSGKRSDTDRVPLASEAHALKGQLDRQTKAVDKLMFKMQRQKAADLFKKATQDFRVPLARLRRALAERDQTETVEQSFVAAARVRACFNSLMDMGMRARSVSQVWKLKESMKKDGIFPNASTLNILLDGTLKYARARHGHECFAQENVKFNRCLTLYDGVIETLWKEALPQTYGARAGPPLSANEITHLIKTKDMSYHARRNLQSRFGAILEIREHPEVLASLLNTYLNVLGHGRDYVRLWALFDILCPDPTTVPKPENVLGDRTHFTTMLSHIRPPDDLNEDKARRAYEQDVLKVWNRWQARMDHALRSPSTPSNAAEVAAARRASEQPRESQARRTDQIGECDSAGDSSAASCGVMIDQIGLGALISKGSYFDRERQHWLAPVLEKYLGLSHADASGIIQQPKEILRPVHEPLVKITSPELARAILRAHLRTGSWQQGANYFSQIWAISTDYGQARPVKGMPFGPLISRVSADQAITMLSARPDPVGCVLLIDQMRAAVEANQTDSSDWIPASYNYERTMRSIADTIGMKPQGHSAKVMKKGSSKHWELAKKVMKQFLQDRPAEMRLSKAEGGSDGSPSSFARKNSSDQLLEIYQDEHCRLLESFLKIARHGGHDADEKVKVNCARDALDLLDAHIGLQDGGIRIIAGVPETEVNDLRDVTSKAKGLPRHKGSSHVPEAAFYLDRVSKTFGTATALIRTTVLALNTGEMGSRLASKERVVIWKELVRRLREIRDECANIIEDGIEKLDKNSEIYGRLEKEMRNVQRYKTAQWMQKGAVLNSDNESTPRTRLMLSTDDLRVLSEEGTDEDEVEEEEVSRPNTRRGQAMERELHRWVKG